jgi:sugar phosphate isomerase/epimerase
MSGMKTTRRDFLASSALAAAAFATGACRAPSAAAKRPQLAVQLYSIYKIFWKKPEECLAKFKAGGYEGVEFAGYGGRTARQIRDLLAGFGLKAAGTHVNGDVELVGDELKRTLDFCAEAGIESVTTPHAKRDSAEGYAEFGRKMGLAAEAAAPYGIKVGIHTTYHHFTSVYDGVTAWDLIYRDASPLLQQQVDTANTFHTGTDVVALLKKYRNRHHSIHLKENVPTVSGVFGEPPTDGGPVVPWDDVLAYMATEKGCSWYIVESEGKPADLEPSLANARFLLERMM